MMQSGGSRIAAARAGGGRSTIALIPLGLGELDDQQHRRPNRKENSPRILPSMKTLNAHDAKSATLEP